MFLTQNSQTLVRSGSLSLAPVTLVKLLSFARQLERIYRLKVPAYKALDIIIHNQRDRTSEGYDLEFEQMNALSSNKFILTRNGTPERGDFTPAIPFNKDFFMKELISYKGLAVSPIA